MPEQPHIFSVTLQSLSEWMADRGLAPYRARQVLEWVYRHGVIDPQAMTSLARQDRELLAEQLVFRRSRLLQQHQAGDGTVKLLMGWDSVEQQPGLCRDNSGGLPLADESRNLQTECVMIPADATDSERGRRTACISSQVGCPVGCRFCASGIGGLDGNLTAGQIVEQVWRLSQLPSVDRITNVVFMGMGEPLVNFDAVIRAARTLNADWAFGISARKITISTVGLPAQMRRLAEADIPVTLAISLHAPNDELRRRLIPWAEYVTVNQIIEAGDYYFSRTGREITLEYILLGEFNDQPEHARQLAGLARRIRSNVNLIRYNEVVGLPFRRPHDQTVQTFQRSLRDAGVNVHLRASRGRDIAAACGQLRHEANARVTR